MRGNLKHYTIYVNSTTSSQRHIVHSRNMTLSGLSPNTMYHTYITASTSAGEGVPSAGHTFQTKGDWNLTLPLVSLVGVGILMVIFMLPHVRKNLPVLWPKIPKPEIKLDEYFTYIKVWDPTQTPSNPPITEVEEMEPLSPLPDPCRPIISGYEKRSLDISGNPESTSTPHITEKKRSELLPPLLPPPSPSPDRCRPITSGYEKHFMPTLEEVMGSC
ncbi:uncharacterized protein [Pyxicephalus adspersus]|uniref:uncharacterized protein n=1 Tax=Pyxicephalus adspersus TaxID=30357 RepID=UPI003B5950D8